MIAYLQPGLGVAAIGYVEALLFQVAPTELSALAAPVVVPSAASVIAVLPLAIRAVNTEPATTIKSATRISDAGSG